MLTLDLLTESAPPLSAHPAPRPAPSWPARGPRPLATHADPRASLQLTPSARWLEFSARADLCPPRLGEIGAPGLWKRIGRHAETRLVFEAPRPGGEEDEPGENPWETNTPETLRHWAECALAGRLPAGWQPPDAARVEAWLPGGALTLQHGAVLSQGRLLLAPDRWALRFPLVPAWPDSFPPERAQALRVILADAQSRWRMARVGFWQDPGATVLGVEVDFTGGPHAENLLLAGLGSARNVVMDLAETVSLLADLRVGLAWEMLSLEP